MTPRKSALTALATLFALVIIAAPGFAVSCSANINDRITTSTTLTASDPIVQGPCPGNGIVIGADNIVLDCAGFTISGAEPSGYEIFGGIVLYYVNNVTVKNCVIKNFTAPGISVKGYYGGGSNNIVNNTLYNNYVGVYLDHSSYNNVTNNTVTKSRGYGIYLGSGTDYNTLANNIAQNSTGYQYLPEGAGIWLDPSSHNTLYNNTARYNTGYGITLMAGSYHNVTSNNANNNSIDGFWVHDSDWNNLTANIANYNGYEGIALEYKSDYNNLTSNSASNNARYGIYLYGSDYNNFTSSTVKFNTDANVWMEANPINNSFTGGSFTNSKYGFRLIDAENTTLKSTNAASNSLFGYYGTNSKPTTYLISPLGTQKWDPASGIYIWNASVPEGECDIGIWFTDINESVIADSNLTNCSQYGVWLERSNSVNITNNDLSNAGLYGVWLNDSSNENTISNNDVCGNGIEWDGPSSNGNTITGNSCEPDYSPPDSDGDGTPDYKDNCPAVPNPTQTDTDNDGIGNACDACPQDPQNDIDHDGVCGNVDNCPTIANPDQKDRDRDTIGDACDNCPAEPGQPPSGCAAAEKIAWNRWDSSGQSIWTMNPDGTEQTQILPGWGWLCDGTICSWKNYFTPDWSPDSARLVFRVNAGSCDTTTWRCETSTDLWTANADGSGETRLTNTPQIEEREPQWSPDGSKIAFVRFDWSQPTPNAIWVANADGSGERKIHDGGIMPDWSPDGTKIIFTSNPPWFGPVKIQTMNADGSNVQDLITSVNYQGTLYNYLFSPHYSADGAKIVFETDECLWWGPCSPGQGDIWIADADGTNPRQLTSDRMSSYPTWSPDGELAFMRDSAPWQWQYRIWKMAGDGSGLTQLTTAPLGVLDVSPSWASRPRPPADVTPPTIISATITPSIVGPVAQISITKSVTDDRGIESVVANIINNVTGATVGTLILTGPIGETSGEWAGTFTFPTQADALDGSYVIEDTATDTSGNSVTETDGTILLDRTGPTVMITAIVPAAVRSASAVAVTVSASDQLTGFASQADVSAKDITIDMAASLTSFSGSLEPGATGTWTFSQPTATPEGSHTEQVMATDAVGNVNTATGSFMVDDTPPTISCPADKIVTTTYFLASGTATDAHSGVATVLVDSWQADLVGTSWNVNLSLMGETNRFTAIATDRAGNEARCSFTIRTDSDGDGIPDAVDQCPDTYVNLTAHPELVTGCPAQFNITAVNHTFIQTDTKNRAIKTPLPGLNVYAFNVTELEAAGVQPVPQNYARIVRDFNSTAMCQTDAAGVCLIGADVGQRYLLLGVWSDLIERMGKSQRSPIMAQIWINGTLNTSVFQGVTSVQLAQKPNALTQYQTAPVTLTLLTVPQQAKVLAGKSTKVTGSELEIIMPDYVSWNDVTETYPIILTSDSDWTVDISPFLPPGYGVEPRSAALAVTAAEPTGTAFTVSTASPPPKVTMRIKAKPKGKPVKSVETEIAGMEGPQYQRALKAKGRPFSPLGGIVGLLSGDGFALVVAIIIAAATAIGVSVAKPTGAGRGRR